MNCSYNANVAALLGCNAGLAAGYLEKAKPTEGMEIHKRRWVKCSAKKLSGIYPHMSECAAARAFRLLLKNEIVKRYPYDRKHFDNTYYYTVTDYGKTLMEAKTDE